MVGRPRAGLCKNSTEEQDPGLNAKKNGEVGVDRGRNHRWRRTRNFARKKKCKSRSHAVAVAYVTPVAVHRASSVAGDSTFHLVPTPRTMEGLFFNVNAG
jgi:hypothetical protein